MIRWFGDGERCLPDLPAQQLIPTLKRLCRDDAEALDLLDKVTSIGQGVRTDLVDNVNEVEGRPNGNSRQHALRKLRKDAPKLHAQVIAGELSPHAAMVKAGHLRKVLDLYVGT